MQRFRLILDPPTDGPTNMAVDEALLEACADGSPATLRLYRWSEPTVSLGYFQRFDELADQPEPVRRLAVVRRPTGGGAILHDRELTYALVLPAGEAWQGARGAALYGKMHEAVSAAVEELAGAPATVTAAAEGGEGASARRGPFWCFARHGRWDLLAAGGGAAGGADKLAGSAQRRTRAGTLQHGSVVLSRSFASQPSAAVDELLGRPVEFEELAEAVCAVLRDGRTELAPGELTDRERELASIARRRHLSDEWLRRR